MTVDMFAQSSAAISECGQYRYTLSRRWGEGPTCLFVMLNPSTADAQADDPTIRRCIGFAKREGCGGLTVINLYTLRTKDPAVLARHSFPHGPASPRYAADAIASADGPVICAWGADPLVRGVRLGMLALIRACGKTPMCLGTTKDGNPRHPLYVKGDQPLLPLDAANAALAPENT